MTNRQDREANTGPSEQPSMPAEQDQMTDSPGNADGRRVARRPGKRDRLVAAASELLRQQSAEKTTLVDIARLADVPVGNVYYYFKTKEEIVETVIENAPGRHPGGGRISRTASPAPEGTAEGVHRRAREPGRLHCTTRLPIWPAISTRDTFSLPRSAGRHSVGFPDRLG
jgi:AcrR family transcriptional regulator